MSWEEQLRALIEARTGIEFAERQMQAGVQQLVESRMRELQLSTPEAYVRRLTEESTDGPEFTHLIKVITVGYSYFFRDPDQIEVLVRLIARISRHGRGRIVHVWSAACATGEEPYTLAMRCVAAGIPIQILATDMNPDFAQFAATASYSKNALKHVPREFRRFFSDSDDERFTVVDEVRERVVIQRHNLLWSGPSPRPATGGWDVVLCRNAYIYFSAVARKEATARFAGVLDKDGWLFLGASETLTGIETHLLPEIRSGRVGYRKRRPGGHPILATPAPAPPRRRPPRKPVEPERSAVDVAMMAGHQCLGNHDFDGALEAYVDAQRHGPLRADIHYATGVVHRKVGDLERAQMALRRALFLQPDYWPASFLIAGVYERMGRTEPRRRALQQTRDSLQTTRVSISSSPTAGVEAFELDPDQVLAQCLRLLA